MSESFTCIHCKKEVPTGGFIGTHNRNHCPFCLWSRHVDEQAGDRASLCNEEMEPIGLTLKKAGLDKYGKPKQGEVMIIHRCTRCQKINLNRIAGDDDAEAILSVINNFLSEGERKALLTDGIVVLTKEDEQTVRTQLFGKS